MDVLARAVGFERAWLRAQATRITPVQVEGREIGHLLLTGHARHVRDHNAVILHAHAPVAADTLVDVVDDRLAAHGLDHGRIYCEAPGDADRLHDEMTRLGYEAADTLVMRWPDGVLAAPNVDGVDLVEADAGLVERWTRVVVGERTPQGDEIEDFVRLTARQHELGVHFLVATLDGDPIGGVRVYLGDDVGQVEELDVLEAHRGSGVARALLARALLVAQPRTLVFLTSDPDDWPTRWYGRLGFQVVGRSTGFSRVPDDVAP